MRRRTLLGLAALGGAGAFAIREATIGNCYYSGPVSDHFDGTEFFNPDGAPRNGFLDLLRWQTNKDRAEWPDDVGVSLTKPDARVDGLRVTMVGHATLLIQAGGVNLLTDPVWSHRCGPYGRFGPARVTAPGIAFADLPPIDLVLLSHNHYDHMDMPTLARLHARDAVPVITPLGNDTIVKGAVDGIDARAGDWGDAFEVGATRVRLLPCHHWSARGMRDRRHALWASFAVDTPAGRILVMGDTSFDRGRPYAAAAAHGPYRLAVLPIGAYAPRWFMHGQHQDPAEAVAGLNACGAAHAVADHWGTFQLTDEPWGEPPELLTKALAAQDVDPARFRVLPPGGAWDVPEAPPA